MKVDSRRYGWVTLKIQEALAHEIDKEISRTITYGYPKYRSRSDFVAAAAVLLLEKERSNNKQSSGKKLGEEIIVARK
jgi:Arc/MetJ-type ribon-helix-helix transcriptional regulator